MLLRINGTLRSNAPQSVSVTNLVSMMSSAGKCVDDRGWVEQELHRCSVL